MRVAAIAMAVAALIWLLLALINLGPGVPIDLLIMAMAGALLDGFVALELWQQRWSRTLLVYVIVRTVVAAAGFSLLCLPAYVVALIAIPTTSPFVVAPDPDVPHRFRPRTGRWGWSYAIASLVFARRGWGKDETGQRICLCGKPERDEVHDPAAS